MDYLAQHFIAFARRELQAIIERLSGIEKVLQRQVESKEKTDTATDKHQHSPTVLRAELEISHSEKYRDEAKAARELVRETWKLYVEIFTLLVVFGYTAVSAFQLSEMRKATKASIDVAGTTARALEENKRQFQDTLKQMKQQTVAQRISANTAKDTLHISERAYLTIDVGPPDYDQRSVNMLLTNTGHIPPTQVKTTVHEATVMRTPISLPNTSSPVEEMHWTEDVIDTLPGTNIVVHVRLPELDRNRIEHKQQRVIIVGQVVYNDGFPNTKNQTLPFCFDPGCPGYGYVAFTLREVCK